jgi:hypothetical protein
MWNKKISFKMVFVMERLAAVTVDHPVKGEPIHDLFFSGMVQPTVIA